MAGKRETAGLQPGLEELLDTRMVADGACGLAVDVAAFYGDEGEGAVGGVWVECPDAAAASFSDADIAFSCGGVHVGF